MIIKGKQDLILGLLLMVIPTIFISYPILNYIGEYYSLLFVDSFFLALLFAGGISTAYLLHGTKLRFVLVFGLLTSMLYLAYRSIGSFPFTEFDAYFIANRFKIHAAIFTIGWFTGFGISRWRYFPIVFSLALIAISVIAISSTGESDVNQLAWLLAPPSLYLFYMLFIKELILNIRQQSKINYGKIFLRLLAFCTLIFLLFWLSTQLLESKFQEIEEQIASNSDNNEDNGNANSDEDSMLDKDAKQRFRLKDYTELRPRLRQSEELLFSAYIDNFIGENIPNPQYITLYHLNQYNPDLERFEIDPDSQFNDLFIPDPTQIPNYFVSIDTSVLIHDKMEKGIKQVKSSMYINELSPDVFVAPSTAYSCQPISVEEEFRDQYKFAYNVYSEVSTLNSAYFVYNATDPAILAFQKQRYAILNEIENYDNEPEAFMDYYTRMPEGPTFNRIARLADSLTVKAKTPLEKVLAIRDYFLSKDENGDALFTYTLTPGDPTDPNIPDAALLSNFLFSTQKGYCTYFAAATLFMLRSMDIPVRMAVGFLTVDRSHNNPGWYWFYADQAHAWTQVYFPEYGWLDFDMTIGNEGAEQAPQPDATPPTPPTTAYFVGKGVIQSLDTLTMQLEVNMEQVIVKQDGIKLQETRIFELNATNARVYAGKAVLPFKKLMVGDSVVVVSFDEKINKMRARQKHETVEKYLDRLPEIIHVQEIHAPEKEEDSLEEEEEDDYDIAESVDQWVNILLVCLLILLLALLLAPYLHYKWLLVRIGKSSDPGTQSIAIYKHSHLLLNQLGIGRGNDTPMRYAQEKIDLKFHTHFADFIACYLKLKYSREELTVEEKELVRTFYPEFNELVLSKYDTKEKIISFLKVNRWFNFLLNLNLSK